MRLLVSCREVAYDLELLATVEREKASAWGPIRFGKYLLLERLSVGGMAEVWRAIELGGARRPVAIKRLLPTVAEHPELVSMFIAEATLLLQLDHPHIVRVYELGQQGNEPFISMEFIRGKDLRQVLNRCRELDQRLPLALACQLICKLCEGLDFAHRWREPSGRVAHLVHRDVSPSNLLLGFQGELKLIDFGIAHTGERHWPGEWANGKRAYMSPEHAQGLPIDRRSDIFSVGACFLEMLTGQTTGDRRAISIVPPPVEQMVLKALAPDPENRYQHASELVADLQRFLRQSQFEEKDLPTYMQSSFGEEIEAETQPLGTLEIPAAGSLPRAVALGPLLSNALAPPRPTAPSPAETDAAGQQAPPPDPSAPQRTWSAPFRVSEPVRASVRAFAEPLSRPEGADPSPAATSAPSPDTAPPPTPTSAVPTRRAVAFGLAASAGVLAIAAVGFWAAQEANSGFLSLTIPAELVEKHPAVAFRGEPLPIPENGRLLHKAKAGGGLLTILADGYQPFSQSLRIDGMHKTTEVSASLAPVVKTGLLAVVAEPEDAEVRVDGNLVAPSGAGAFYLIEIPVGAERSVQVKRAGYHSFESRVRADTPGAQAKIRAKLQPLDYSLTVSSSPAGALIWANGARLGHTPMEVRLPSTTPELMVGKRCYEPAHVPLSNPTEASEPLPINVTLTRLPSCR